MKSVKILLSIFVLSAFAFNGEAKAQEGFIGEVKLFAGNFAPRGWALCEGQLLSINSNTALFSIVGTTYGGDGRTTFALPDLRGRVVNGNGHGPGLSPTRLGARKGAETVTLSTMNMPPHTHEVNGEVHVPAFEMHPDEPEHKYIEGSKSFISVGNETTNTIDVPTKTPSEAPAGARGEAISVVQPSLTLNYIICLQGIFPSRN